MADTMIHNRWLTIDSDTFIIWFRRTRSEINSLGVHMDFPWSEDVKRYDAPQRANIHLVWWFLTIALNRDGKSQVWHHKHGNVYRWRRITWHPAKSIQCRAKYVADKGPAVSLGPREWECARLRGHRGDHA